MKNDSNNRLKVTGQMTQEGADKVGSKLGNAALILAIGFALAAVLAALGTLAQ